MITDTTNLTGWKYDRVNLHLEVWVKGTNVAVFNDGTNDLTLPTNGMTIDSGGLTVSAGDLVQDATTACTATTDGSIQTDGGFGVAGACFIGGSLTVGDEFTYAGELYHAGQPAETKTSNFTVDSQDCGKIMKSATDSLIWQLPATSKGHVYTFVNTGTAGACAMNVHPHSNDKIVGITFADTDSDDDHLTLKNTGATGKPGDMIKIIGDGSIGWYITQSAGTWARS